MRHTPVTVVAGDEQAVVRRGLQSLLDLSGITAVAEAASARETVRWAAMHNPDVAGTPSSPSWGPEQRW